MNLRITSNSLLTIEPVAKQVIQRPRTDTRRVETVLAVGIGGTEVMVTEGDTVWAAGDTQETAPLQVGRAATGAAATFRSLAINGLSVDSPSSFFARAEIPHSPQIFPRSRAPSFGSDYPVFFTKLAPTQTVGDTEINPASFIFLKNE